MAFSIKDKFQDKITNNFIKLIDKNYIITNLAFENSPEALAIESDGKLVVVNPVFARLFKYGSPDELIGKGIDELVDDKDKTKLNEKVSSIKSDNHSAQKFDIHCICKDKSCIYVELGVSSYFVEETQFIVYGCKDITENEILISSLELSIDRFKNIIESTEAFFIHIEKVNGKLKPVYASSKIEKITGYSVEKFLNDSRLWLKVTHPDDLKPLKKKTLIFFKDSARFYESVDVRIISGSGNVIWLKSILNVTRDTNGSVTRLTGLFIDITHSKKGEFELVKSLHKLREQNSTKDKFISIISHDLRTPFSSILGFTDILLNDKDISHSQHDQYINFIQESSQNILSLVNSLLDWTRIQTGRIKFEPERLNACGIIDKAVTMMTGTTIQKDISLTSLVSKELFIHADFNLTLQVFNNLISNAIKFTHEKGSITILAQASHEMNHAEFIVKDTGIGIKKEHMDKLFKVDAKFTNEGTAGEKGSGLGLSLVHEIVVKHGGKIWVQSALNKGTEIHFTMPIAASSVLLVDDSKTDRLLYAKILKNFIPQYRIDEAANGKEAFEYIINSIPALVITDHKMPEMSGYDLVKKIQSSDMKGKPPIIVLSVDVNPSIIEEYKDLNIEFVFQKPVNLNILKEAVDKSLKKAIFN